MLCDRLWKNARLATMRSDLGGLGVIEDGMIGCAGGRIVFAGSAAEGAALHSEHEVDCDGRWITPGLIDCHTHLVHAGNRAGEFERRLAGESYEAIARAGGGILSTVRATRSASEEELVETALPRLDALMAEGVTTVEVKSGYGLTLADEVKMLRAIRALGHRSPVTVVATFLGAHALPPEYTDNSDGYVELLCKEIMPAIAAEHLADAVDGYCEGIGFSPAQIERVFAAAGEQGLPVKLHAEQLSNLNGAALAARHKALSADHLEYLSEEGAAAMANSGTVAVLLPGAFYFMRETQLPPVDTLRREGVPIALATDCNPGTSPLTSILLVLNMAATLFRLTVEECLLGVTRNAAGALGIEKDAGTLETGKLCDLAIWNVETPAELVYRIGFNPLEARIWRGK
jgi:imidazolonepropionase